MGLGNRVSVSCLVMRSPSIGLVFRFLWRYVGSKLDVYKWTGKNDYVALCEPEYLSFGCRCVTFLYFIYLFCQTLVSIPLYIILNRAGRYGLYLNDTLLDGSSAHCSHSRTNRFVHRVRGWERHF